MSPVDLLSLMQDKTIVGTWHTHPGHNSNLSQEDYAGFLQWPDLTHYIVGTDGVRSFVVEDSLVVAQ